MIGQVKKKNFFLNSFVVTVFSLSHFYFFLPYLAFVKKKSLFKNFTFQRPLTVPVIFVGTVLKKKKSPTLAFFLCLSIRNLIWS